MFKKVSIILLIGTIALTFSGCTYISGNILREAAYHGDIDKIENILTSKQIDIDIATPGGATALFFAIMGTELDTAGRLLLKGASINHLSKDGNNALMALLNVIDKEDTHWTKKRLNYQTSIKRILEVIQFLIDAGIDINNQNKDGDTALMKAVRLGNIEIVKILLSIKEIDVSIKNDDKKDAMTIAQELGQEEIYKLLGDYN